MEKSSVASCKSFSWKHENKVPLGKRPTFASLGSLSSTGSCSLLKEVSFSNKGKIRSAFSFTGILVVLVVLVVGIKAKHKLESWQWETIIFGANEDHFTWWVSCSVLLETVTAVGFQHPFIRVTENQRKSNHIEFQKIFFPISHLSSWASMRIDSIPLHPTDVF